MGKKSTFPSHTYFQQKDRPKERIVLLLPAKRKNVVKKRKVVIILFTNRNNKFMDILLIIAGCICLIVGLIGCILPMLPGPPVAYAGLLLLHLTDKVQFSTTQLLLWLATVVIVQILDYFVPMLGSKYSGGSRWGTRGCLIGTLIGLFFMPWGIILGPFLGAFIGELLGGRETGQALKSGLGSLLGFLFGTVLKCVICGYFVWKFIEAML